MSAIKCIRTDLFRLSQGEFAGICGVSQATVSRWEGGEFLPNLKEMQRIREEALARGLAWSDSLFFADAAAAPELAP